jgi:hypothetical protein
MTVFAVEYATIMARDQIKTAKPAEVDFTFDYPMS